MLFGRVSRRTHTPSLSADPVRTAGGDSDPEPRGTRFARPAWRSFSGEDRGSTGAPLNTALGTLFEAMSRGFKTRTRTAVTLALLSIGIGTTGAMLMHGHSASYLSTRYTLSETLPSGAIAPRAVNLREARARFIDLATQLHADPKRLEELKPEFRRLIDELDPLVKAKRGVLAANETELQHKEADLGWLERNIGPLSPAPVAELRDRVEGERDYLTEARAIRDGAWIVFGIGQTHRELDPATWTSQIDQAAAAVPGSGAEDGARRAGLTKLVREQEDVKHARDRAAVLKHFSKMDVDHLGAEVPWYNKPAWLDWVTLGVEPQAELYRTGEGIDFGTGQNLAALEKVVGRGEDHVNGRINDYLKDTNPEYRDMRARYDLLKPAWDNLTSTVSDAERARSAVSGAEAAITFRNLIALQEPSSTQQVSVNDYDDKGNYKGSHLETQPNPAHATWAIQYAAAQVAATATALVAERRVADVNSDLAALNPSLAALGKPNQVGKVDASICSYFGGLFRAGLWSYDGSQASAIQDQLGRLSNNASRIKSGIEPDYTRHFDYVWGHINAERASLLGAKVEGEAPLASAQW